jgi:hypothetical protein
LSHRERNYGNQTFSVGQMVSITVFSFGTTYFLAIPKNIGMFPSGNLIFIDHPVTGE